jgi:hypothetical protein
MTPVTGPAAAAIPSTQRRRLGDGMVRPVRALEIKDPYTGWFRLIPGRDQVSIDWPPVKKNPSSSCPSTATTPAPPLAIARPSKVPKALEAAGLSE